MLKKLLKYDFSYMFKFWWIGALISFIISVAASGCIGILDSERDFPVIITVGSVLLLFLAVFSLFAFVGLTSILIFIRFYKNLFSDEGYLTFTLPVKTASILNSKIISALAMTALSVVVVIFDVVTMLTLGLGNSFLWDLFKEISKVFAQDPVYVTAILAETVLAALVLGVFSTLFTYICISVAAVITKKARVVSAVGIYYGANSIFTFITQMFFIFGTQSLTVWIDRLPENGQKSAFLLVVLVIILFFSMLCGLMYALERYILDRKLNLA